MDASKQLQEINRIRQAIFDSGLSSIGSGPIRETALALISIAIELYLNHGGADREVTRNNMKSMVDHVIDHIDIVMNKDIN